MTACYAVSNWLCRKSIECLRSIRLASPKESLAHFPGRPLLKPETLDRNGDQYIERYTGVNRLMKVLKRWLLNSLDSIWRFQVRQNGNRYGSKTFQLDAARDRGKCAVIVPDVETVLLTYDSCLEFDVFTYSYSGNSLSRKNELEFKPRNHLAFKSESFGESIEKILERMPDDYAAYAIISDDILITSSQLNLLFAIGNVHGLEWWGPTYSHCSFFSHYFMLNRPGYIIREVEFIEWNCALFSGEAWGTLRRGLTGSISGWGYDQYLIPHLLRGSGMDKFALIDSVVVRHCRPISSNQRALSNGLTAADEQRAFAAKYPRK